MTEMDFQKQILVSSFMILIMLLIGCSKSKYDATYDDPNSLQDSNAKDISTLYNQKWGSAAPYFMKLHNFKIEKIRDCDEFKGTDTFDDCLLDLSRVTDNSTACDELETTEPIFQSPCYYWIGVLTKNEEFCSKASLTSSDNHEDKLNGCLAVVRNDTQLCNGVANKILRKDCFMELGVLNDNEQSCAKLEIPDSFECFAMIKKDAGECKKLDAPENRNFCVLNVAKISNVPNVCKNIDKTAYFGKEIFYACKAIILKDISQCAQPSIDVVECKDLSFKNLQRNKNNLKTNPFY